MNIIYKDKNKRLGYLNKKNIKNKTENQRIKEHFKNHKKRINAKTEKRMRIKKMIKNAKTKIKEKRQ